MQRSITAAIALFVLAAPAGVAAQGAGGQLQGFGGYTFGEVASDRTFGGSIAVPITSNVHLIAEGGHMNDVMPALIDTALDFTSVDVRLNALYGEGGIRIGGGNGSGIRPYGLATAGVARITPRVSGFNPTADIITNTALQFLDTTKPMLGVGGGLLIQGGPVVLDLGYRYKKVLMGDAIQRFVTGGDFGASQVRVGLGFRF